MKSSPFRTLLFFLLLTSFLSCKEDLINEASGQFSTLCYNVAGLPQVLSGSKPEKYMTLISPGLNKFDLVHVQEDFCYHDSLLLFNNHANVTTPSADCVPDSDGLNTFTNFEILDFERVTWQQCFGFDCLTPKGFSFSRIELEKGVTIDFYNVHCNAGRDPEDYAARRNNIKQLLSYLDQKSYGEPVIIIGDFNCKYTRSGDSIRTLLNQGFRDPWLDLIRNGDIPPANDINIENCYPMTTSFDCEDVDKAFYRNSTEMKIEALSYQYGDDSDFFYQGIDSLPLSDHEPLTVTFSYEFKRN